MEFDRQLIQLTYLNRVLYRVTSPLVLFEFMLTRWQKQSANYFKQVSPQTVTHIEVENAHEIVFCYGGFRIGAG